MMYSMHFLPFITKPTRIEQRNHSSSATVLDQIWLNSYTPFLSGVILHDIADHYPVFSHFNLPLHTPTNQSSKKQHKIAYRPIDEEKLSMFITQLELLNWDNLLNSDVNESYETFTTTINNLYCEIFPLKIKYISENRFNKPWLTSDLLNLIKTKSQQCKLYKLGFISKEANNRYKNWLTAKLRKAEHDYYIQRFHDLRSDAKNYWKTIKNLMGTHKKQKSDLSSGDDLNTSFLRAEDFNNFFSSIGNSLESQLPQIEEPPPLSFNIENTFFLKPVTDIELDKIISQLKNVRSDVNTVPVALFKRVRHLLVQPLKQILNLSFVEGTFPEALKIARITPIHKKRRC